jgi:hypothetical protein
MNKLIFTFSMMLVAGTAVSGCVTTNAEGVKQHESKKTTVSGERLKLNHAVSVKYDCSARILPEMRVLQAPQHGTIEIANEKVEGKFRGAYSKCTGKETTGTVAYYTSQKGFVGQDKVVIRDSFKDGVVNDHTSYINVVK